MYLDRSSDSSWRTSPTMSGSGEAVEQRGLAGLRAAGNEDVEPAGRLRPVGHYQLRRPCWIADSHMDVERALVATGDQERVRDDRSTRSDVQRARLPTDLDRGRRRARDDGSGVLGDVISDSVLRPWAVDVYTDLLRWDHYDVWKG